MATDDHEASTPIPTIRVNDLEVIEMSNGSFRTRAEKPPHRQKRLDSVLNLRECGCTGRGTAAGKTICAALHKIGDEQRRTEQSEQTRQGGETDQRNQPGTWNGVPVLKNNPFNLGAAVRNIPVDDKSPGLRETFAALPGGRPGGFTGVTRPATLHYNHGGPHFVTSAIKRPHTVAFPSCYFDPEACLNFFRIREATDTENERGSPFSKLTEHALSTLQAHLESQSNAASDVTQKLPALADITDDDRNDDANSDAMSISSLKTNIHSYDEEYAIISETSSVCSSDSVQSVGYDFNNSGCEMTYQSDDEVRLIAPHKVQVSGENKGLLHPVSANNVKYQHTPRRSQPKPDHMLHGFYSELGNAPDEAFDEATGGLKRDWLHAARPEFFNASGELQEYVIHRAGRPVGMSQALWLWLCGRDGRLPPYGPPRLALKIAVEMMEAFAGDDEFRMTRKMKWVHNLSDKYDLDRDEDKEKRAAERENYGSIWNKMARAERGTDWTPVRMQRKSPPPRSQRRSSSASQLPYPNAPRYGATGHPRATWGYRTSSAPKFSAARPN